MNNTRPIRVTAAAGTNLAGTSYLLTFIIFRKKSSLRRYVRAFSSSTEACWIVHLYTLSKILYCCQWSSGSNL